jgi:CubicO group peptidase (beta-lactamase class C family)
VTSPADAAFEEARRILHEAIHAHATPAAVAEVGRRTGRLWTEAFGKLTYDAHAPATTLDTIFDLASLTKVIVTTSLAMRLVERDVLSLETRVADRLESWRGSDREDVTIRHLLDHSSGLPAHAPLWQRARGRDAVERLIAATPLEAAPGARAVYSDLGFMLLGFVLTDAAGATLDVQWDEFRRSALPRDAVVMFPHAPPAGSVAPTEIDSWRGRLLRGEVHDENAAALGGVAAHAGLFGTARSVGAFARLVLQTFHSATPLGQPATLRRFATPVLDGSSRALGWDTMRPTSSCGPLMSPTAIGHTGFTGTSLWIDQQRDLYVVLLTNRVHPTRENQMLPKLRAVFHDAVIRGVLREGLLDRS